MCSRSEVKLLNTYEYIQDLFRNEKIFIDNKQSYYILVV